MAVFLSPAGGVAAQFFDNNGNPLAGGFLYTYAAGTNTPQATYTSAAGSIAQPNPIVLDSAGRVPGGEIWLIDAKFYKFVLQDANNVLIATYDNITGINNQSATQIIYTPPFTGGVAESVSAKLAQTVSVKDFGAVGDGVTDDSGAFQAAVNAATALQINQVLAGSTTYVNGGPAIYIPTGIYIINTTITTGSLQNLVLIGDGKVAIIGNTSLTKGLMFMIGSSVRYLNVQNIQFQNFSTVFKVSTGNADLSHWYFYNCQADGINLFIDSVSYALSRSTNVNFSNCTWQYNCVQIARIFCDVVCFNSCWIGSSDNSTSSIYANSALSFYSCMFVPAGSTSTGRCAILLTNDDGAGGTANDISRGVVINGCRASNEGGQGPLVVCNFPVANVVTDITPAIVIQGCDLVGYEPNPYEAGNSESGIVYLQQYPAFVSFESCGFSSVGGTYGKVVAKSDSLTSSAPVSFGIYMDAPSFAAATRTAGLTSGATIAASMRQYINNPDPFTFRSILEGGHLAVVDSSTTGMKKATFTINTGYTESDYGNPIVFFVYLGGQGTTGSAAPNDYDYFGASVYIVTLTGLYSGSALNRLSYTKLAGDSYGNGSAANADIVSVFFGTGDTGSTTAARAVTQTITITFGTNVLYGTARIENGFRKFSQYGLQPK